MKKVPNVTHGWESHMVPSTWWDIAGKPHPFLDRHKDFNNEGSVVDSWDFPLPFSFIAIATILNVEKTLNLLSISAVIGTGRVI